MSFKREGNDKGLLDSLRRRRVKELLGEDIPEDEAKLLCNGRFACLVCSHNPVFDTVNMLMVHRQGKKHAASEEIFLRKKKELQALILKRKHEQYRKDGTTVIKQAVVSSAGGIMASQPYDPRVKKHKVKPYERKPCLDLHSDFGSSQSSDIDAASGSQAFPTAVPMKHGHQLKNIFQSAQRTPEPVRPYVRQHKTFTDNSTSCHPTHSNQFPVSVSSSDRSISQTSIYTGSHYCEPVSLTAASVSSSHSGFINVPDTSLSVNTSSSSAFPQGRTFVPNKTKFLEQDVNSSRTSLQSSGSVCSLDGISDTKGDEVERSSSVSHSVQAADKPGCVSVGGSLGSSTEKKQLAQKYYHLSGSGWKKDWDGKWIRDEEAEFDSDEEPPDLP